MDTDRLHAGERRNARGAGSHTSGRPPKPEETAEDRPAIGPKGSVLICYGGVWHRNGPNTTADRHRMGANIAYIPAYIHRPPNGWPLVRRALYERSPARLQQLLERSVE